MKKMVIKQQILVYFPVLRKWSKPSWQCFDILQGHPMLVKLLVHSIHVSDNAISLNIKRITLVLSCRFYCFIWFASSNIFDSICLSHPRSKDSLLIYYYFFWILLINSAYFILWSSLTRFRSVLNSAFSTII